MSGRTLKIALAASVALNLFALAAGATLVINRERVESRAEAQQTPGRTRSPMGLVGRLSPEVQPAVRQTLRSAALSARPDFEEARGKRREALALARSPEFDPARLIALLDQSRAAELRGRRRLEAEAVTLLADLEPADRVILAEILARKRGGGAREPNRGASAEKAVAAN
ncbi:MAG: periplasmic heavy metal sensor [Pseudomonadota bacterium]|nr:periplasmic heavy metal sensor [Pseudomonadota bacterium]